MASSRTTLAHAAIILVCLCVSHCALAAVVYDGSYSVSARSTFSSDSDSSAPEGVTFINFKVAGPSASDGSVEYLAHIGHDVALSAKLQGKSITPQTDRAWNLVTVLNAPQNCSSDYDGLLGHMAATDDVWSPAFLDRLILAPGHCGPSWTAEVRRCFSAKQGKSSSIALTVLPSSVTTIPSGPYLVLSTRTDTLFPVYRLYTDAQYAFTVGLLPATSPANASQQTFVQAPTGGQDSFAMSAVGIPVPSRLYFGGRRTPEKPLMGMRVAVKDIIDVAGTRTGCGNRAYYSHYNTALENSFVVQQVLQQGGVIVGKTKASQFANGENPTADWIDQLCPFNVRGDGYQNPSSSSSGSGAAQGAYHWIDVALGSDTGGSIRGPAGVNGVLGIRPSTGMISLEGVMPLSDVQDTVGYFARDAHTFAEVGNAFYGHAVRSKNTNAALSDVTSILVPSDFWTGYLLPSNGTLMANTSSGTAAADFVDFLGKVSSHLGSVDIQQDSFVSRWNASGQAASHGLLSSFLNTTYPVLIGLYQYRALALPFMQSFSQANGGRRPFVDPVALVRWAYGESVGEQGYKDALAQQSAFTSFVRQQVLPSNCSSLLVYSQSDGSPSYRNEYFSASGPPFGFGAGRIANLAGVPEIVIPISQATYNSSITLSTADSLPVAISIVGGRNCDGQLLRLASTLERVGITTSVKVGASTF